MASTLNSQQIEEHKKFKWFIMHHKNNCTICGKEFNIHENSYYGHLNNGTYAYTCETCSKKLLDATSYTNTHKKYINIPQPDTKLWRYMDLAKFLSLLESNTLFFTRLDHFIDPFEGALGVLENEEAWKKNKKEELKRWFKIKNKFENSKLSEAELEKEATQHLNDYRKKLENWRTSNYVSCWHKSDFESEAMWKLYTSDPKQGIAIQTTFERLYWSLQGIPHFNCSMVNYINYNGFNNGTSNDKLDLFDAPWFKRKSFEHEKEFRVIVEDDRKPAYRDENKQIKVDLNLLIENVYISPQADDWFVKLVKEIITKRYDLGLKVHQSDLNKIPFY